VCFLCAAVTATSSCEDFLFLAMTTGAKQVILTYETFTFLAADATAWNSLFFVLGFY
jgi:hypothetical protein